MNQSIEVLQRETQRADLGEITTKSSTSAFGKVTCLKCGKTYSNKQNLSRHDKINHMKIMRHYCKYCGKGWYEKASWLAHVNFHERKTLKNHTGTFKDKAKETKRRKYKQNKTCSL